MISDCGRVLDPGITRGCNGAAWFQVCQHYSSVIEREQPLIGPGEFGYNTLTCPTDAGGNARAGGAGEQVTAD